MAYTTIDNPGLFFNTVLYTGNGTTNTAQTGVGFQPDWTWIKSRSTSDYNHFVFDAVRGATKYVKTDANSAENTLAESLKSFDTDGFTVGTESDVNNNSTTYASWNWKANGSGSSNSDGTISSTVSANTTAGFSIVSYTGTGSNATVGHGLGAVPKMIFFKDRETAVDWGVYAEPNGNTKEMYLSTTDAAGTNTNAFNSTTPTSSVFTIGTSSRYNPSSKGVIAYCFADVKGYLKIGSYTGNGEGSGEGPFIHIGFRPAFFLLKETSGSDNWTLMDNKRLGYNPRNDHLFPNLANVEYATDRIHMVSNGIKIIDNDGSINQSGSTYVYLAFAESPFVNSKGVPTNAR